MRIIASALIALSLLVGLGAPASAFDAKSLFGQLERAWRQLELTPPTWSAVALLPRSSSHRWRRASAEAQRH